MTERPDVFLNATAHDRAPKLDFVTVSLIYLTIFLLYSSNLYQSVARDYLYYAKWISMLLLLMTCINQVASRRIALGSTRLIYGCFFLASAAIVSTVTGEYSSQGVPVLFSLLLALATAITLAAVLQHRRAMGTFIRAVTNVGCLVIASSLTMWLLRLDLGRGGERFSGWTDNPNTLGMMLAPTLVILFARTMDRRKRLFHLDTVFLVAGLFLLAETGSRASMAWVAASIGAFWIARYGAGLVTIGALVAGVAFAMWGDGIVIEFLKRTARNPFAYENSGQIALLSGRIEVWQVGIDLFHDKPLVGYGIGSSIPILASVQWQFQIHQGLHFHSSYLSALVEIGIIGASTLILILFLSAQRSFKTLRAIRRFREHRKMMNSLPYALLVGSICHGLFETWILSAGNANMLILWTVVAFSLRNTENFHPQTAPALREGANLR